MAVQVPRALRMLDGLQAEGEAAVFVHYKLSDDIRALKRIQDAMADGKPLPMALREARIWGARERLFERALPRLSGPMAARLVSAASECDGVLKGLRHPQWPAEPWDALRRLVLMMLQALGPRARRPGWCCAPDAHGDCPAVGASRRPPCARPACSWLPVAIASLAGCASRIEKGEAAPIAARRLRPSQQFAVHFHVDAGVELQRAHALGGLGARRAQAADAHAERSAPRPGRRRRSADGVAPVVGDLAVVAAIEIKLQAAAGVRVARHVRRLRARVQAVGGDQLDAALHGRTAQVWSMPPNLSGSRARCWRRS